MESRYRKELALEHLRRVSPANPNEAEAYYTAKVAQGVSPSTLIGIMGALDKLDRLSEQTPFDEIVPHRAPAHRRDVRGSRSDFTTRKR
jgi:hypothetical protein